MKMIIALLCAALLAAGGSDVAADQGAQTYTRELQQLSEKLARTEQELDAAWISRRQLENLRSRVETVVKRAVEIQGRAEKKAAYYQELVDALGPPPEKGKHPEVRNVAAEREELNSQLAAFEGATKKANVLAVKGNELLERISATATRAAASERLERRKAIWSPGVWKVAHDEIKDILLGNERLLTATGFDHAHSESMFWAMAGLALLVLVAARLSARHWLPPELLASRPHLSGDGRLGLQIGAQTALPVLLATALGAVSSRSLAHPPALVDLLTATLIAAFAYYYSLDLGRMILAPESPRRLISSEAATRIRACRRVSILAACIGLSLLFHTAGQRLTVSTELLQVVQFGLRGAAATLSLAVIALVARSTPADRRAGDARTPFALRRRKRPLRSTQTRLVVFAVAGLLVLNPVLVAAGYMMLADWLFVGLFWSTAVLSGAWLVRALASDLAALTIQRFIRPATIVLGGRRLTRRTSRLLHVAAMGLINLFLVVGGLYGLMSVWGVDMAGTTIWTYQLLQGIEIGNMQISIFDVVGALLVMAGVLVLTRFVRRLLSERVLPNTRLDHGAQSALYTGTGYIGLILAVTLAIATIGIDLTELALVLGGLAVGIGFGLQHIANNIVSGLVMLVERPVKPGDWVAINGHQGFVHRISLRATELRSFQNASVLVPNAEIVGGTLTNWTHRDRSASLCLSVALDYSADDATVTGILMQCAKDHRLISRRPAPYVYLDSIDTTGLRYELWAHVANAAWMDQVQSELYKAIVERLREAGVRFWTYSDAYARRPALEARYG